MYKLATELLKVAKLLSSGKPGEFIEVGDKVVAKTRKGTKNLIVAGIRYAGRGKFAYVLTLAEPERPEVVWTWKVMSNRYDANSQFVSFAGRASTSKLKEHQDTLSENIRKRDEADYEHKDAGRKALDELKLQKGDRIAIRGPGYNWDALVGAVNYATGKVGIVRSDRDQRDRLQQLIYLTQGRTTRMREFRWIPAQHVVKIVERASDVKGVQ